MAEVSSQPEHDLVVALDELWRRRIIREQGVDAYDFSHDRIREVAYGEISPMLRRHLHRRVAQALAQRHAGELDAMSGQIATHYELAGESLQALHFYELASEAAITRFAHTEVIRLLTRALALTPDDPLRRFNLLLRRERSFSIMAQPAPRLADLAEMMTLAQHLQEQRADAAPLITALTRQGLHFSDAGQAEPAIAALRQAITLSQRTGALALEIEARSILGETYFLRGRLEEALAELAPTIERALGAPSSVALGRAYEYMAAVSMFSGAMKETIIGYLEQLLASYRAVNDRVGEAAVLNKLGYAVMAHGEDEYAQAERYFQEGMVLCRDIGDRARESLMSRNLGLLYTHTGDYARAEPALRHSLEIDQYSEQIHFEGAALNYFAFWALSMGDFDQAQALNDEALEKLVVSDARGWLAKTYSELGLLHHLRGDQETALKYLSKALQHADRLGDQRQIGYALTRRGHALTALGRLDEAVADYCKALELHRAMQQTNRATYPLAGLANVAHLQGELPRAQQLVEEILAHLANRNLDATDEALQVYLICARILHAAGDLRAAALTHMAQEQLERRAATIVDDAARRRFWAAPLHSAVAARWTIEI